MKEKLVNEIITALSNDIDASVLNKFRYKISAILSKYEVSEACTDISVYQQQLPDCYKCYMVAKKIEGASVNTLYLYKLYLEHLLLEMKKPVKDITKNDLMAYMYNIQKERHISNRSLNNRRSVYSSFFGWVAAEGYIDKNPMLTIKPIKYEQKRREALTPDEMEIVRQHCETIRDKAIVEVLYSTACRVSELSHLDINDVDFNTNTVSLFGKGSKYRVSYLSPRAKLYLQEYLKERSGACSALFTSTRAPHTRLTPSGLECIITAIGKRAGIHLHPHIFRHTSATDALQHGMDITQVQQILGHARLDTTMIYAQVSGDDVARSHAKFIH